MVAYNFRPNFVSLIWEGKKCQTIRAHRKGNARHARPGEPIQLYRGMRTKACQKIITPDPIVTSVENIEILITALPVASARFPDHQKAPWIITNDFARADGFMGADHFTQWWRKTHGPGLFEGVLIKWPKPPPQPLLSGKRP